MAAYTKHIFLIGMMGSGKTTIANILSDKLNIPYVDTDKDLSSILSLSMEEIFTSLSEKKIRILESIYFVEHLKNQQHIYATGGGIILNQNNRDAMKQYGKTILLKASSNILLNRLINDRQNKRPFFEENQNQKFLEDMWNHREKHYIKSADHIIETDNKQHQDIVKEIMEVLK